MRNLLAGGLIGTAVACAHSASGEWRYGAAILLAWFAYLVCTKGDR